MPLSHRLYYIPTHPSFPFNSLSNINASRPTLLAPIRQQLALSSPLTRPLAGLLIKPAGIRLRGEDGGIAGFSGSGTINDGRTRGGEGVECACLRVVVLLAAESIQSE